MYVRQQASNEFEETGVLCLTNYSFIVKFDTTECISLLFGCCNLLLWSYKLGNLIEYSRCIGSDRPSRPGSRHSERLRHLRSNNNFDFDFINACIYAYIIMNTPS